MFFKTNILHCYLTKFVCHEDNRGYFFEISKSPEWEQANCSFSKKNVVRGIHIVPYAKQITCISGKICDVVVDLRKESTTYLERLMVWLSPENQLQINVPGGCGHGFMAVEDSTIVYLQSGNYDPSSERNVFWRDETLNINWPSADEYILSDKDLNAPYFEVGDV